MRKKLATLEIFNSRQLLIRVISIITVCGLLIATPFVVQSLQKLDIVYEPIDACRLLTRPIAQDVLKSQVINRQAVPEINTDTRVAVSKCSYSDVNDKDMSVIALAVQTGIDDQGVAKVQADFAAHQEANDTEPVDDLELKAFFNPINGQLHLLDDHHWYILNYSHDDHPANTTLQDAIQLAEKIFPSRKA